MHNMYNRVHYLPLRNRKDLAIMALGQILRI